ncbi:hypothetical protein GMSM_45660 [Geomonas sp. Red276]
MTRIERINADKAKGFLISANLPLGVTTALVGCQSGQRQQRGGEA